MAETFNQARRYSKKPGKLFGRGMLLFLLPLPLLVAVIVSLAKGMLGGVLANALAAGLYLLAAISTRRGLRAEIEYQSKRVALPPKMPFKLFGVILVVVATLVAAYAGAGHTAAISICFGIGAYFGFYFAYGLDPRSEKGAKSGFGYTTQEVVEALEEAEGRVLKIETAGKQIGNPELRDRLHRIVEQSRKILRVIEEDPKDLRRARKFLNTYLEGAERVSRGYAKTHGQSGTEELEDNFRNVLSTIEEVFGEQYHKLLENDVLDLDVQIEVLTTQLKREGVI